MARFDVIVIGAGHNGLTTAALLAKKGRKVVVLEASNQVGGILTPWEFHPGFRSPGALHDTTAVRGDVIDILGLGGHGLRRSANRPAILALGGDEPLLIDGPRRAVAGSLTAADQQGLTRMNGFIETATPILRRFLDRPPLDLVDVLHNRPTELMGAALGLRKLGGRGMLDLLRTPAMSVADFLGEYLQSNLLKGALALPAVRCSQDGPRSPGTTFEFLLSEANAGPAVVGGGQALVSALEASARAHGVEIRTGARVQRLAFSEAGSLVGAQLSDGEMVEGSRVAASCHPAVLLGDLVDPALLSFATTQHRRSFRARGSTAQVLLAVSGDVRFSGHDGPAEYAAFAPSLDFVEKAHDAIKYRKPSEHPALEIFVPTSEAPDLAPEGHHVVSVLVHFSPFAPDGGWDEAGREGLWERTRSQLTTVIEDLDERVLGHAVLTPEDMAERFHLPGGHLYHGEHGLDQRLVRPFPNFIGYGSPLPGVFLSGSGSHPGGGVTCGPGRLAADRIAKG